MNKGGSHSAGDIVARSFKSAPAQNAASTLLPTISARVGPLPFSAAIDFTCDERFSSSSREIALRAFGRFSCSTRTCPDPGAGICWVRMMSSDLLLVLYRETKTRVNATVGRVTIGLVARRTSRGDNVVAIFVFNERSIRHNYKNGQK